MMYLQPSADKTILKALHPWSKTLTKEEKDRLRAILKRKGSGVWERNKNRLKEEREKGSIRKENNKT